MAVFYASFIPDFSMRAASLHALKRKAAKFTKSQKNQSFVESLKQALGEAPVLQFPDYV